MSKIVKILCFRQSLKLSRTKILFCSFFRWNCATCSKYFKKLIFSRIKCVFKFYKKFMWNKIKLKKKRKKKSSKKIAKIFQKFWIQNDIWKMIFYVEKINCIYFSNCFVKNCLNKIMMIHLQNISIISEF